MASSLLPNHILIACFQNATFLTQKREKYSISCLTGSKRKFCFFVSESTGVHFAIHLCDGFLDLGLAGKVQGFFY